jgi:predicted  nucleic acid-binding Zn-ribbon protein
VSELSKDDVKDVIRDAMREIQDDFSHMRDQIERVDRRIDTFEQSHIEIRELSNKIDRLYPRLEDFLMGGTLEQLRRDVDDTKQRTQNIERGISTITTYLQEIGQIERDRVA